MGTSGGWTPYTIDEVLTLTNVGDCVQFQNTNESLSTSSSDYVQFSMTGKIAGSGNIQSMLNYSESCSEYCYANMFYGCSSLTSAPELPATTVANHCYRYMFYGCSSLTSAPELPATTVTRYCYYYMFYGCSSLTSAPELPATTLNANCYQHMFYGCSSLTSAPELPATTLANYCYYYMFYECSSLTSAPELPATTLTTSCYQHMFYRCTKLNYIKVGFTSWSGTNATYNWVYGVSSTGTFEAPIELPIEYGASKIPTNWDLPALFYIIFTEDQSIHQNYENEVNYTIQYTLLPETLKPTFTIIDGSLPEGLTLDSSTGVITGTSSTTFEGNLTIQLSAEGCESVTMVLSLSLYEVGEIQTTPHNLTSNTSDSRYEVSQSTNLAESKRLAWNAMDGSLLEETGCSHTNNRTNQWWKIKFNEGAVLISKLTWTNRINGLGTYLSNPYKIQGSNDDSTWSTVYTINDLTNVSEAVHTWGLPNSGKYQYWRILQEGSSYLIIGELEFEYSL